MPGKGFTAPSVSNGSTALQVEDGAVLYVGASCLSHPMPNVVYSLNPEPGRANDDAPGVASQGPGLGTMSRSVQEQGPLGQDHTPWSPHDARRLAACCCFLGQIAVSSEWVCWTGRVGRCWLQQARASTIGAHAGRTHIRW